MQNITPFLWFDDNAEEAANYYVSLFKNSQIQNISRYGEAGPREKGTVMTVSFALNGVDFIALNGGSADRAGAAIDSRFKLSSSSAVSFVVNCKNQAEVDRLWAELSRGGEPMQCGWIRDKYGVTWQIVPEGLVDVLQGDDPQGSARAMQAMFQMEKLDIDALRRAYEGK
jgi:predicted 3-demethylubiquinone-9 3-methyltransferase (glyoxalase superfamily)